MKRKKQGASLIVVIIIFMFISTVSMAMLSMVVGNYKARVAESKRVENLYASESGVDVAYNVIAKTFDAATRYGYYKVETLKNGNNTGSYKPGYEAIKLEIASLQEDIAELEVSKSDVGSDVKQINKDIAEKRGLIEEDEEMQKILLDEEFKRAFKNFVKRTDEVGADEQIPDKLEESIEGNEDGSIKGHKYVRSDSIDENSIDNINDFIEETIDFAIENKNNEPPKLSAEVIYDPQNESKNEEAENIEGSEHSEGTEGEENLEDESYPRKEGHLEDVNDLNITRSENKEYEIIVKSTFYTEKIEDKDNKKKTTNERQLQVKYKMLVPNYSDIFYENVIGDLNKYKAFNNRALTIGGDMNVGNVTTVDQTKLAVTNGDVFVNGNPDRILSNGRVYGKYFGGITLNNSDEVLFGNNVITRGTFNVRSNVGINDAKPAKITGDLYARNIYAGTENGNGHTSDAYVTINGETVIDNDLALKAANTHITMSDFYGINDKNIEYKDIITNGDSNPRDKARTSSSIIINDMESDQTGSSVTIKNNAYIMGTAHIDTRENGGVNDGYQTGESTAVKGNYEAYSVPLDMLNSSGNPESFEYYDPLELLKEPNVFTKGEHFKKYWNETRPNKVDSGGIYFEKPENIYSIGAVILYNSDTDKKEVVSAKYGLKSENESVIEGKRLNFAKNVYNFGQEPENDDERESMLQMYNSLGTGAIEVEDLMDFSEDFPNDYNSENDEDYDLEDEIESDGEKAIFNSSDKTIVITDKTEDYDDTHKYIVIDASHGEVNAVIATLGSVIIDGDITFNGTIIAKGDLTITGDVKINYSSDVIERVQAENNKLFNYVFGSNIIVEESAEDNSEDTGSNINDKDQAVLATKYDLKNFLESKLWKILE